MLTLMRQAFAGLAFGLLALAPVMAADERDPAAEAFVQEGADKVFLVLGDETLTLADKKTTLRAFLDDFVDIEWVAKQVLGRAIVTRASPEELTAFTSAYREYATQQYEVYLEDYAGQTLDVVGSRVSRSGRTVQVSSFLSSADEENPEPIDVAWIVRRSDDQMTIRDVIVRVGGTKFKLLVQQQQDIAAIRDEYRQDIGLVTAHLERVNADRQAVMIADMENAPTEAAPTDATEAAAAE